MSQKLRDCVRVAYKKYKYSLIKSRNEFLGKAKCWSMLLKDIEKCLVFDLAASERDEEDLKFLKIYSLYRFYRSETNKSADLQTFNELRKAIEDLKHLLEKISMERIVKI